DQDEVGLFVEHLRLQALQPLRACIPASGAIYRGDPGAWMALLEFVPQPLPENQFGFGGIPAGRDAVAKGDDLYRLTRLELRERRLEEPPLCRLCWPTGTQ